MILEFKKEDFKKGSNKITIVVPFKTYHSLPCRIDVRSPYTGTVKTFIYSRPESEELARENEFWDGEEQHSIYVEDCPSPMPIVIDVMWSSGYN